MTTASINSTTDVVQRIIKVGLMRIEDPHSYLPLDQAIKLLVGEFPILRFVKIYPHEGIMQQDGSLLYDVPTLPTKHNG